MPGVFLWYTEAMDTKQEKLRNLPKADIIMDLPILQPFLASAGRKTALEAVRKAVDEMRQDILSGDDPDIRPEAAAARACRILEKEDRPSLRPVINATGIILHTNLGRAKLIAHHLQLISHGADRLQLFDAGIRSRKRSAGQPARPRGKAACTGDRRGRRYGGQQQRGSHAAVPRVAGL